MRYGNISEQFGVTGKINISVKEDSETIMESLLHAEELALIPPTWSEKRKKTFVMGRLAAKQAMERFKMEAAAEVGVNLKQGYNGDLTSRQAGSDKILFVKWSYSSMNR